MGIIIDSTQEVFKYIANPELVSPTFFTVWQVLRIAFLVVTAFFVGLLVYLFSVNDYLDMRYLDDISEFRKTKPRLKVSLGKDWKDVVEHAKSGKEAERKMAVIEADDMIDSALSKIGYGGETLLDKLAVLNKEIIPNIEEVKDAHRKRRDIAYDPNKSISREEAEQIISVYEEVFKDLRIL